MSNTLKFYNSTSFFILDLYLAVMRMKMLENKIHTAHSKEYDSGL